MAVFNWIFFKKFFFSSAIVGLSSTPIFLINKYSSSDMKSYVSDLKKNLGLVSSKYAEKFGVSDFSKEALKILDLKNDIEDVFAEDVALKILNESEVFLSKKKEFEETEDKDYEKELEDLKLGYGGVKPVEKILDRYGGNRSDMRRRILSKKAHSFIKDEILKFSKDNFSLNQYLENDIPFLSNSFYFSRETLDDPKNWDKIGFFPLSSDSVGNDKKEFEKQKFNFINWAHKVWFQEVKPFYTWMSLWKYSEDSAGLKGIFDSSAVKIDKPSYNFPHFDDKKDSGSVSTNTKFQKFFENVVKNSTNPTDDLFVPKGYTDDSSTAIYVEASNMYSKLYIKFAAAANHKYSKVLKKAKENGSGANGSFINCKESSESVSGYNQPFQLFLSDNNNNNGASNKKQLLKIDKSIFSSSFDGKKDYVSDVVEIKDSPWMFIRNQAGIHAVAVDSATFDTKKNNGGNGQNSKKLEDVYKHFKYRTLQLIQKSRLNLEKTVDVDPEVSIKSFQEYLKTNFSKLLVKYVLDEASAKFSQGIDSSISAFSNAYKQLEKAADLKRRHHSRRQLREALIKEYAKSEWEVDNESKFKTTKNLGLAGVLPYDIKTTDPESGKDRYVFEELEKVYDYDFFEKSNGNSKTNSKSLSKEYKETIKSYETAVETYVEELKITINFETSNLKSERIFTNNYFINSIIDRFLERIDLFNQFLFKFYLKSDYIGKSILGNKGFIEDLEFKVPDNYKQASGENGNFFDSIQSTDNDIDKIKKLYGKLDDYLVNYYYSKTLLKQEKMNPWDIVKYSGVVLSKFDSDDKFKTDKLTKTFQEAFKENLLFDVDGSQNDYYKFINTIIYLSQENFSGFRSTVSSKLNQFSDAYLLFENPKNSGKKFKLPEKYWANPYLQSTFSTSTEEDEKFKKERDGVFSFLSSQFLTSTDQDTKSYIFKGLFSTDNSNVYVPSSDTKLFVSEKLYKFGSSAKEMDEYVQNISSEEDFRRVVQKVKEVVTDSDWSPLDLSQIYVKDSGGEGEKKIYRSLTLQEKKNLLSAYLNHVKVEIKDGEIEKSKYKGIFLADPENNYNLDGSKHTEKKSSDSDYEKKLGEDKNFEITKKELKEGENSKYYVIQVSLNSLSTFEKFKSFVNSKLKNDLFWMWVLDTALDEDASHAAVSDLSERIEKKDVYDAKWREQARTGYFN